MGSDKNSNLLGDGSFLTGAIFMSNRTTKKECFSRKLFGLPSFQADFVKKIKIGMILFLFEYEERKLYGVFEATSDGATNIIPTAFVSSGKLFSAQVCFRIIWRCRPLTEPEFHDAIKDNYYAHNKFHFHLSDTQVYKLLQLFYSRRCCSKVCKLISGARHSRKNGEKKYQSFRPGKNESNEESNTDPNMCSDLPGTDLDELPYHKRSLWNADNAIVGMEAALHPTVSLLEQPELPDTVNSTSRGVHAFREKFPFSPEDNSCYQLVPGLHLKEFASYSDGSLDHYPFMRYQCYHSHPDQDILSTSSAYQIVGLSSNPQDAFYPVYESSSSLPALASNDIRKRVSITNLQDPITRNFQNRVSITNLQNSNHPSSLGFNDHYTPDISSSNQGNYTKLHLDVTTSVHSPDRTELLGYGHCATTSQSDDNSRGPRYFRIEPHEIVPCSEYEPNNLEIIESSFCSSPEKTSSRMPYGSGPSEYQDEGSSSYQLNLDDEYYPVAASSNFHLDSHERRISVFSRLSGLQKARAEQVGNYNPNFDVSFDELVSHLSSRRKYWSKMTEVQHFKKPTKVPGFKKMKLVPALTSVNNVFDQFVMLDDDKQLENAEQLGSQTTVLCPRGQSCCEGGTGNASILPFLNFKRRSEAQRVACGTETSNSVELRESEVSLVKHKRRKLLRPSFGEEDASNNVDEIQNVLGTTQDSFLKGNVGESIKSVDIAVGIGNETHVAARSSCGAGGTSQEHLIEKVQVTVSEHMGNVRSSPASQSDVAKPTELNSEDTIFIKGKSKFQNVQESSQNLHGSALLVVDGNGGGDDCSAGGRKEVEIVNSSHAPHNDNAKTDTTDIASGRQYRFRSMQSAFEHFHEGPLFVKIGDSKGGVEQGDASNINASGSERMYKAEYSGECRSCSCKLEGLSKRHVCQTSASAAQDIGTRELSSNQCCSHDEATENNQEENISTRLHFAEFGCKNTKDSQKYLVGMTNTQENLTVKVHSTDSDSEITCDSQRNLFRTALGAGQLSSSTCIHYSAEASRDTEEERIGAERNPVFDSNYKKALHGYLARSAGGIETAGLLSTPCLIHTDESALGITVKFCGKGTSYEVVDSEMRTHQRLLSPAQDMGMRGSLSKPCTIQTGNPAANTEDHAISHNSLPDAIDKDKKTCSCNLVREVELLTSGKTLSNPIIGFSEAAESTQPGKNEDRLPAELNRNCTNRLPAELDSSRSKASHL